MKTWWWVPMPAAVMCLIMYGWLDAHGVGVIWSKVWMPIAAIILGGWLLCKHIDRSGNDNL